MIVYKLFRIKNGILFPLYVYHNSEVVTGVKLEARIGPEVIKNGRVKVKARRGTLAFRPGWHSSRLPIANHIGPKRVVDGKIIQVQAQDTVWCECEIYGPDITEEALKQPEKCFKDKIHNGFYRFKTNALASSDNDWYISSHIKVNRILNPDEVNRICLESGVEPQLLEIELSKENC